MGLRPDLSLLRAYSREAQAAEPCQPPYVARFRSGDRDLWYVASSHQAGLDSPAFRTVAEAFESAAPRAAVLEGLPVSAGPSPASYVRYVQEHAASGFKKEGELAYAAHLALRRGIPFVGGEPSDREVYAAMNARGYSTHDLMAYELLRMIPIWRQRGMLEGTDISRQVDEYFADPAWFDVPKAERLDFAGFQRWYQGRGGLGKPYLDVESEDLAPLADGSYFERLSAAITEQRDRRAVQVIARTIEERGRVLAVFGGAHLVTARPVLEAMLGRPEHMKYNLGS